MATIQVADANDLFDYKDARNWVIDDLGRLHVVGTGGNLASFNANHWQSVEFIPASK